LQDSKIGRAEAYARRAWDREGPCHTGKGDRGKVVKKWDFFPTGNPGRARREKHVFLMISISPFRESASERERRDLEFLCVLCGSSERERAGGERPVHHRVTEGAEKGEAVCVPGCCREARTVFLSVFQLCGSSERERAGGEELLFHHRVTEDTEKGDRGKVGKKWDFFPTGNPGRAR